MRKFSVRWWIEDRRERHQREIDEVSGNYGLNIPDEDRCPRCGEIMTDDTGHMCPESVLAEAVMKYSKPLWAAGFVLIALGATVMTFTGTEAPPVALGAVGVVLTLNGGRHRGIRESHRARRGINRS